MSDFTAVGGGGEVKSLLTRLQDMMKAREITSLMTDLISGDVSSAGVVLLHFLDHRHVDTVAQRGV